MFRWHDRRITHTTNIKVANSQFSYSLVTVTWANVLSDGQASCLLGRGWNPGSQQLFHVGTDQMIDPINS